MGGTLAPNSRFVSFAIKIIEFHESNSKCPCSLYLESKSDCIFNPHDEAETGNIIILDTIMDKEYIRYVDYYLVECRQCKQRFEVIEREGHYTWWKWTMI